MAAGGATSLTTIKAPNPIDSNVLTAVIQTDLKNKSGFKKMRLKPHFTRFFMRFTAISFKNKYDSDAAYKAHEQRAEKGRS